MEGILEGKRLRKWAKGSCAERKEALRYAAKELPDWVSQLVTGPNWLLVGLVEDPSTNGTVECSRAFFLCLLHHRLDYPPFGTDYSAHTDSHKVLLKDN